MKTVSVYELRDNLAYYLDFVAKTETPVIIEKYNVPTAVINPYKKGVLPDPCSFKGFLGEGEDGERYVNKIRRSRREREYIRRLRNR